ncbi:MAG: glycosyltransferase family 4 protein [Alphaproteobacteria bacterium]|nr:glycosyltransferase family 4 protein [Alphaproteobacteria bacterium]
MKDKPESVLLLIHELNYTGAPLVVFETALALKKRGYKVHTLSLLNGELVEKFKQNDLEVSIYENNEKFMELAKKFDFAIVNTLACKDPYKVLQSMMPTIWWIHEKLTYAPNKDDILPDIQNAFSIITSSPASRAEYLPYNEHNHLVYLGIKDAYRGKPMQMDFPSFAVVGSIVPRKGQDIFIQAIEQLPPETRKKAGFFIIGEAPNETIYNQIKARIQYTPEITLLPATKSFEEICEYYENISALVAPSREEPTSRVAIEAMMMARPVIMSDVVGAQYLVQNGVNGFIFKSLDITALSGLLARLIENPEILEKMQQPAREAYLKYNSETAFSNAVEDAILSDWHRYYK